MSSQQPAPNYDNYTRNYNDRPEQQYSNPLLQQTVPMPALTSSVSIPEISNPNLSNTNELLNSVSDVEPPRPPPPPPRKNNNEQIKPARPPPPPRKNNALIPPATQEDAIDTIFNTPVRNINALLDSISEMKPISNNPKIQDNLLAQITGGKSTLKPKSERVSKDKDDFLSQVTGGRSTLKPNSERVSKKDKEVIPVQQTITDNPLITAVTRQTPLRDAINEILNTPGPDINALLNSVSQLTPLPDRKLDPINLFAQISAKKDKLSASKDRVLSATIPVEKDKDGKEIIKTPSKMMNPVMLLAHIKAKKDKLSDNASRLLSDTVPVKKDRDGNVIEGVKVETPFKEEFGTIRLKKTDETKTTLPSKRVQFNKLDEKPEQIRTREESQAHATLRKEIMTNIAIKKFDTVPAAIDAMTALINKISKDPLDLEKPISEDDLEKLISEDDFKILNKILAITLLQHKRNKNITNKEAIDIITKNKTIMTSFSKIKSIYDATNPPPPPSVAKPSFGSTVMSIRNNETSPVDYPINVSKPAPPSTPKPRKKPAPPSTPPPKTNPAPPTIQTVDYPINVSSNVSR